VYGRYQEQPFPSVQNFWQQPATQLATQPRIRWPKGGLQASSGQTTIAFLIGRTRDFFLGTQRGSHQQQEAEQRGRTGEVPRSRSHGRIPFRSSAGQETGRACGPGCVGGRRHRRERDGGHVGLEATTVAPPSISADRGGRGETLSSSYSIWAGRAVSKSGGKMHRQSV